MYDQKSVNNLTDGVTINSSAKTNSRKPNIEQLWREKIIVDLIERKLFPDERDSYKLEKC